MEREALSRHFKTIGARIKFSTMNPSRIGPWHEPPPFTIDVGRDCKGEYFEIESGPESPELEILQTRPKDRHLLLYSRDGLRFLCGHDERHWFVAPITGAVSTVRAAKQSLMPQPVLEQARNFAPGAVDNRRNVVFKRQGEWFFVPSDRSFHDPIIHRNEPIQKSAASKSHICEELIRADSERVYIVQGRQYSVSQFEAEAARDPGFTRRGHTSRYLSSEVYARGSVRHSDHSTIHLDGWHLVLVSSESASASVAFLD